MISVRFYRTIEGASRDQDRSPSLIFLEEWSTSGRVRPTLGHLLQLLVRMQFYRAADFVAVHILGESPPPRPLHGPAARVDIRIPEEVLRREIESQMENVRYPNTASINANGPSAVYNPNLDYPNNKNVDERIVNIPVDQQTAATQSNNNTHTEDNQLRQMTANFAQLSTSSNVTSRNTQTQHTDNEPGPSNVMRSVVSSVSNSISSNTTQNTNVDTSTSGSYSMNEASEFIPRVIGNDGIVTESNSHSTRTYHSEDSTNTEYNNSFIPTSVTNGNSGQTNLDSQSTLDSQSSYDPDSNALPAMIASNGIRFSELSTSSVESSSDSNLIPLSVRKSISVSSERNGTSSQTQTQSWSLLQAQKNDFQTTTGTNSKQEKNPFHHTKWNDAIENVMKRRPLTLTNNLNCLIRPAITRCVYFHSMISFVWAFFF